MMCYYLNVQFKGQRVNLGALLTAPSAASVLRHNDGERKRVIYVPSVGIFALELRPVSEM